LVPNFRGAVRSPQDFFFPFFFSWHPPPACLGRRAVIFFFPSLLFFFPGSLPLLSSPKQNLESFRGFIFTIAARFRGLCLFPKAIVLFFSGFFRSLPPIFQRRSLYFSHGLLAFYLFFPRECARIVRAIRLKVSFRDSFSFGTSFSPSLGHLIFSFTGFFPLVNFSGRGDVLFLLLLPWRFRTFFPVYFFLQILAGFLTP